MSARAESQLPASVVDLLDGTGLEHKIGHTFLLATCDPTGWPRLALLSVGEVLAPSATQLDLALYQNSRTTRSLTDTGRALLSMVLDGSTYKIRLTTHRVAMSDAYDGANAYFRGKVIGVDDDRVGYARLIHGIEYELVDERPALQRWQRQLDHLRELGNDEHGS